MARAKDKKSYLYCIIKESKPQKFKIVGLGDSSDCIHTVHYKNLAAVVGQPPRISLVTRDSAITHEKVIEEVMKRHTVLPVSFGAVADSETAVRQSILQARFDELSEALVRLKGKIELDLKAFWLDMDTIFKEIADELGIHKNEALPYAQRINIGEKVAQAVEESKKRIAEEILIPLAKLAEQVVDQEVTGDRMVFSRAFLVPKNKETAFDKAVNQIAQAQEERMKFKYIASPPYSFVDLRLTLA